MLQPGGSDTGGSIGWATAADGLKPAAHDGRDGDRSPVAARFKFGRTLSRPDGIDVRLDACCGPLLR